MKKSLKIQLCSLALATVCAFNLSCAEPVRYIASGVIRTANPITKIIVGVGIAYGVYKLLESSD